MGGSLYRFGPFQLDVPAHELKRDHDVVTVPGKAFDTLVLLVQEHARVVPKDELIRTVWPDTFVTEDSLTQNISALRRALGDDPVHPKYIATIARRGYRFIAPVEQPAGTAPAAHGPGPAADAASVIPPAAVHHASPVPVARSMVPVWAAALFAGAVAVVVMVAVSRSRPAATPSSSGLGTLRFTQDLPRGSSLASGGVLSPDGKYLAFVAQDENSGKTQLWVRALDAAEPRPIDGTDGASRPFWSPDGQSIGFFAESRVKRVSLNGDPPQTLAPTIGARPSGGTWNTDGTIVYSDTGALYSVQASGGASKMFRAPDPQAQEVGLRLPQFLPDGRHLLYLLASPDPDRAGTYVASLDGASRARLIEASSASVTFVAPAYLVYVRDHVLMAQRFDPDRLALSGAPWALASGVSSNPVISAASNGMLAFGGGVTAERLGWFDQTGQRTAMVNCPTVLHNLTLSPDQRQLIGSSAEPDQGGLWLVDLARGVPTRLIADGGGGVWSGDGRRIAFVASRKPGEIGIYLRTVSGRTDDQLVLATNEQKILQDWSRDGRFIVYVRADLKSRNDLWVLPLEGDRKPYPLVATEANEIQAQVSPDGRWVAYASDESGSWEVYAQSFPTPGVKRRISVNGGSEPQWRADGKALFYLTADHMMMTVDVSTAQDFEMGTPRPLFRAPVLGSLTDYRNYYAVSSDGQRFLIDSVANGSAQEPISFLINWAR